MGLDIKRGYEIFPNNNVTFGIKVTNNTDSVVSDVQVILDYNESLFSLQNERILKLDNIPPTVTRTAKFILKPLGCVHKENIEATISYRDHRWEKHIVNMVPKEIHCVCPFLRPRPMSRSDFLHLSNTGHSIDTSLTLQGISPDEITAFLLQTCSNRLNMVDRRSTGRDVAIYFSGESVGEKVYYLLSALIKENTDTGVIQVILRATSDRTHGINGFLNEVVCELKHLICTVSSAKEIGCIKNEQVINIIDSVVQRSNIINGKSGPSINIKDSVLQRTEIHGSGESPINNGVLPPESSRSSVNEKGDDEISDMYREYLEDVRAKQEEAKKAGMGSKDTGLQDHSGFGKKAHSQRDSLYSSLRLDGNVVEKRRFKRKHLVWFALLVIAFSAYIWAMPLIESKAISRDMTSPIDLYLVGSKVTGFLDAVNRGDTSQAYKLYKGSDFLVPVAIDAAFSNEGIEKGSIQDINIIYREIVNGQALVETSCNVSVQDGMGIEAGISSIPIYFGLENIDKRWRITKVSFYTPITMEYHDGDIPGSPASGDRSGKLAMETVSSNLMIKNIEGVRAKNSPADISGTIDLLKLSVGLNVGSSPVDMSNMVISISDSKRANVLVYAASDSTGHVMKGFSTSSAYQNLRQLLIESDNPAKYYTVEKIRDEDGSFSQLTPLMNTGDLAIVYIATTSHGSTHYSYVGSTHVSKLRPSGLELAPRTTVSIVLGPQSGASTTADFVTPSSYGVRETVQLYP
ncbi:hypothetical protein [Methanolobus sp. WCC5]|uniref:hypothetical protein n=1 Tax=Methanolobus sp. WCC5 TaxID=3125785 RepID=UPI003256996F